MELIKQTKNYNRKIAEQNVPLYTETDTIVPDIKPDIARVLHEEARVCITNKTHSAGKVNLEMEADIEVLYQGEDNKTHALQFKHDFRQSIDSRLDLDNVKIVANTANANLEIVAINSRKLGVRLSQNLNLSYYKNEAIEYITDCDEEHIEKKKNAFSTSINDYVGTGELATKNILEVPVGNPSINEILKLDANANITETKTAGNKVLLKGELEIRALYVADDQTINTLENRYPISEIVGVDNDFETEQSVKAKTNIDKIYYTVQTNEDGEKRIIGIDTNIKADFYQTKTLEFEVIDDMFSTKSDIELSYDKISIPNVTLSKEENVSINEVLQGTEPATSIYNVTISPKLISKQLENDNLIVNGEFELVGITLTENGVDVPKKIVAFEKSIYVGNSSNIDLDMCIENLAYNQNIAGEIEVRANLKLSISNQTDESIEYLTNAEFQEAEEERENRPYAINVYYVKDGDTIWSIAKRYRVKLDDMIEENGEQLATGQKLLIQG